MIEEQQSAAGVPGREPFGEPEARGAAPLDWYKDAVIYQLHVKAFFDGNDDGIGDFRGLTAKLDYIKELGVDVIWLLPFYPSPLRDDGYDIADYHGVHPSYGTMGDFRAFLRAAHARKLRVVTELVINHTSDQHPWFQRARRSRPGSVWRNFYVWSDDDTKYAGTRIIFSDTEKSNWSWDPIAKQYYWHRFFSHQPDLNFDNPRVFDAVANVMRFWFDAGVDGMRLDAVPYLCEREGTNNENLPETHDVIKRLRKIVDDEYPGRFILAEANQWPEDVRAYFGDGDECHMAFHFPLMPRMFIAIASEDRYPIHDIMNQTPPIPESCQWAIFLRNHDELTLEMVTDRERSLLYSVYAPDNRARLNLGIRRRLAPLMENDRQRMELITSLLFSMPGTPVIYYGDEIGMGDNIYEGDRDGVRTPMHWSIDRNGGFSRVDAQRLYLPIIQDPVYGYTSVNVEAQARSSWSLLNWMRRMIAVRKAQRVFGRGSITFLHPENRKVLAYLREFDGQTVLCVANLSNVPQFVELDLSRYVGRVPIEMFGWSAFAPITGNHYVLTLPRYAFYWFSLSPDPVAREAMTVVPEFVTIVLPHGWRSFLNPAARATFEQEVVPALLPTRRWFNAKNATIVSTHVADVAALGEERDGTVLLTPIDVHFANGHNERYLLTPSLSLEAGGDYPPTVIANAFSRFRTGPRVGLVHDASQGDAFWNLLARTMRESIRVGAEHGTFVGAADESFAALSMEWPAEIQRVQAEQSNSSAIVGGKVMLKLYRRLQSGIHPEIEMSQFLLEHGYSNTPKILGTLTYLDQAGKSTAVAVAHEFILSQGDGWRVTLTFLKAFLERRFDEDPLAIYTRYARILGRRLAQMHATLRADKGSAAFAPEPFGAGDLQRLGDEIAESATSIFELVEFSIPSLGPAQADARRLVAQRGDLLDRIRELARESRPTEKTRIHGDFHLGQVLVVTDDVKIVDLEGETQLPFERRRTKHPQLRDVAGMLRSFDYAAVHSLVDIGPERFEETANTFREDIERWRRGAIDAFLCEYETVSGAPVDRRLLDLFVIAKAIYELGYEISNRPTWAQIPMRGLLALLEAVPAR
ncbi:MAG TPA: maltose alpha-D-glucosyltransferase [Candidatus Acidoferrales bacterium]|nr:maltose alpha-D-glucosyltransferase [Candidatus Acidoferrales bacterium]